MHHICSLDSLPSNLTEPKFTYPEISRMSGFDITTVRKLFKNEPGLLVLTNEREGNSKRRYSTTRVPRSVMVRVLERLTTKGIEAA